MMKDKEFQLSDLVRQTAFEIHRYFGPGHLEKVYENALVSRLRKQGVEVKQQHPLTVRDEDGTVVGQYFADLLIEDCLIVELEAAKSVADEHVAQLLGYLRASRIEHGLLLNFGAHKFHIKKYATSDRAPTDSTPRQASRLDSLLSIAILVFASLFAFCGNTVAADKPNVLFIAVDDLNHWVGHLKRNPQTITPNLDRLASMGVSFANAYCVAPACNPSRTALLSGMRPSTTGVYRNPDDYKPHIAPEQTLNSQFRLNGYYVAGAGKIYHGGGGRREEWDDYGVSGQAPNLGSHEKAAVGALKYSILKGGDETVQDYHTVSYCIDKLNEEHDKPFFLACGIFRPHLPWNVPKKYFDLHPLDEIELPPHDPNDLKDLPPAGVKMAGASGDHRKVLKADKWKELVRAYLASISYADAMLGRLLDGLENSVYAGNTIIVLWGDHGWHLGEKSHWRKFALWEEATRAPLIWVAPGVTPKGEISRRTVDFMTIFPTLCELAGLPIPEYVKGPSLMPLLKDPAAVWDRPALTTHGRGNHAVRSEKWRYIRYNNGDEELYDEVNDPLERTNLANQGVYVDVKMELAKWLPAKEAKQVAPRTNKN